MAYRLSSLAAIGIVAATVGSVVDGRYAFGSYGPVCAATVAGGAPGVVGIIDALAGSDAGLAAAALLAVGHAAGAAADAVGLGTAGYEATGALAAVDGSAAVAAATAGVLAAARLAADGGTAEGETCGGVTWAEGNCGAADRATSELSSGGASRFHQARREAQFGPD